jgi:uncharacterized membrane protein
MTPAGLQIPPSPRTPAAPDASADPPLFAARLTPHRSLDAAGRGRLVAVFALVSALVSLPFVLRGAWPVVGFYGFDVFALWLALRLNARGARAYEDVVVTAYEVRLAQVSARGDRRDWRFAALWSRLRRAADEEFGLLRLYVEHRGRSVEIARVLGPDEKRTFADALQEALNRAQRGDRRDGRQTSRQTSRQASPG